MKNTTEPDIPMPSPARRDKEPKKFIPKVGDINIIENAAAVLDGETLSLRMSHTLPPDHQDWGADHADQTAKQYHDGCKRLVAELYALADRMKAQ